MPADAWGRCLLPDLELALHALSWRYNALTGTTRREGTLGNFVHTNFGTTGVHQECRSAASSTRERGHMQRFLIPAARRYSQTG